MNAKRYTVRYIHKISSREQDTCAVSLRDGVFTDARVLGRALRLEGIMCKGERLRSMRVEGARTICFPDRGIWHSIILTLTKT